MSIASNNALEVGDGEWTPKSAAKKPKLKKNRKSGSGKVKTYPKKKLINETLTINLKEIPNDSANANAK